MPGTKTRARALENETILVTGASGFIGGHILAALRLTSARVVAIARRPPSTPAPQENVRWISIPEWSPDALKQALNRVDWTCVIHAAAYGVAPSDRSPDAMVNINVACAAALACLAAGRKAKAYVHVGSCAEYAATDQGCCLGTESILETRKLYGASKAAGTLISHAIAANAGLPFAAARLFNIYGPGEAQYRLLPMLYACLSANREVPLSHGNQVRDFCFAIDAAEGLVAMLQRLSQGTAQTGIYNVCTGKGVTVREFAVCAADAMHKDRALLQFGRLPMRPDDVPAVVGDPSKTTANFGWAAETSLHDGIRQSLAQLSGTAEPYGGQER